MTKFILNKETAHEIASEWISAWNAHDLDRVLSHYTDDFEITSPFIPNMAGEPSGTLRGKSTIRAYWNHALEKIPDLHFTLFGVYWSMDSVAIHYDAVMGKKGVEVLFFNEDGKVVKAVAHYDGGNGRP